MNFNDPTLRALLITSPDIVVFNRPMSKDARKLLEKTILWGVGKASKLFNVSNPSLACIRAFAAEYTPIKFEEACHRFDMQQYITILNKSYSPNKSENLLNIMLLKNLDDESWIQNSGLKMNANRVGVLSNDRAIELYNWLTTYYIVTDFTSFDLNKIVDLSNEQFNFQVVKDEANKIKDIDKKNISYLYAIIRDVTSREAVTKSQEKVVSAKYEDRLQKVFSYGGEKIQYNNPDMSAEWKREREWLDTFIDLKKNE